MAELDDRYDEELDRTLHALGEVAPPAGMTARVLERAEAYEAERAQSSRMGWMGPIAWPLGAVVAAALIIVAMEHRAVSPVEAPVVIAQTPGEGKIATPPFATNAKDGAPVRVVAPPIRKHLSTDVLGGALTHEEMLLVQMSRSNDEAVRDSLDPEKREQDLADARKQFEDFLSQGSEGTEGTENTTNTTGESL